MCLPPPPPPPPQREQLFVARAGVLLHTLQVLTLTLTLTLILTLTLTKASCCTRCRYCFPRLNYNP